MTTFKDNVKCLHSRPFSHNHIRPFQQQSIGRIGREYWKHSAWTGWFGSISRL